MYLTGYQIKILAVLTDGDEDCGLCVEQFDATTDCETGDPMPEGLYAYYDEYPDEGRIFLPRENPLQAQVAMR